MRTACQQAQEWLSTQQEKQGALPLHADPVLTSAMINDKLSAVQIDCNPVVKKPKPKPPPPAPEPEPETKA